MIHIKVHKQHVKESEVSISLMIQTKVHKQHVYNYYILSGYIAMMSLACHEMG